MKTKLILGSLLALTFSAIAQPNLLPSTGKVYVNSNGYITGARNPLEINNTNNGFGAGDGVALGGNGPVLNFYGGTAVPPGLPSTFTQAYSKIGLATTTNHFIGGATSGDFIIQNMTQSKSIVFSSYCSGNGVEQMRLNSSGNLGVGTSSPDAKVHGNYDFTPTGNGFSYYGVKGNIQSIAPIPGAGAYHTIIGVAGISTSGYADEGFATGVVGIASNSRWNFGGDFSATGNGAYDNVGVHGTASGNANSSKNWACRFDGQTYCTSGAWTSSDQKLKENIKPLTNVIEKIKLLKPSTYTYKTDAELKDLQLPQEKQMGLIAQELEEVFPDLVREITPLTKLNDKGEKTFNTPGFKSVQYTSLIPVLIAGIQEQQKTIESQQTQLDEQKKLIEQLSQKSSNTTGIGSINTVETGFQMSQNEPNPFTHETVVKYTLPQTVSQAFMAVYDLTGKQITSFPISERGSSALTITSEKLAAGIYIYSIVADGKVVDSKRMIVAEK